MPLSAASAADATTLVASRRKSSFSFAFRVLPAPRRRALDTLYGFCRAVDDAADEAPNPDEARRGLASWRAAVDDIYESPCAVRSGFVGVLAEAVRDYPIHREDLVAVIEGCEWDVTRTRYETWSELRAYCLRVASAVGLACIEIFGYRDAARAREYATDLGIALQLTNILRDVDEDAARGRIYLPSEDLAAFQVTEEELLQAQPGSGPRSSSVERLLHFEAARARLHFSRAHSALSASERAHMLPAEIMGDIYFALLERIQSRSFPRGRVSLPTHTKAGIALRRVVLSSSAAYA